MKAKRVLVTGGTGFIGGRLVEILAARGATIRVATSDFRSCSRVARFPVELVKASLADAASMEAIAADCDVVFHLGYHFGGDRRRQRDVNIPGTLALMRAAFRGGCRRFVHISTVSAYGRPLDGPLTEESLFARTNDAYGHVKFELEQCLKAEAEKARGSLVILQPTIVYGPYSAAWSSRIVELVRKTRVVLPRGGEGICNPVYVDDVVAACLLAADADVASGERFLISGSDRVTWRGFFERHEKMARVQSVVLPDEHELRRLMRFNGPYGSLIKRLQRELAERPRVRAKLCSLPIVMKGMKVGRAILPQRITNGIERWNANLWRTGQLTEKPLAVPDQRTFELYSARTVVSTDRARNRLGYCPQVAFEEGMKRTEEWARWANLLPP